MQKNVNLRNSIGMQTPYFETAFDGVFVERLSKKETCLFNRQVELAGAIRKDPKTGFQDTQDLTLRSALSQIFTGERNLSSKLRRALFLVIEPRFDKKNWNYTKFERLLIKRFQEAYEKRIESKKNQEGDRDYDKLIQLTKTGKTFLITTLEPAELHKSELANRLKDELLEKTGIIRKISSVVTPATYKFYLSDDWVARQFWEALKGRATTAHGIAPSIAEKRLKNANRDRKIITYIAPVEIVMNPYVFIDYLDTSTITAFCVSYRQEEIPSVAEMSIHFVRTWLEIYDEESRKKIEAKEHSIYNPK